MERWQEIAAILADFEERKKALIDEATTLRMRCAHSKLPKRKLGEQYMDTCPDCGHIAYCYAI